MMVFQLNLELMSASQQSVVINAYYVLMLLAARFID
jgi:hypothetical protein